MPSSGSLESLAGGEPDVAVAPPRQCRFQEHAGRAAFRGMGTTVAGLLAARPRDLVQSGSQPSSPRRRRGAGVGDSRVQRYQGGRLEQLSIDDVPGGPRTGGLTQSLGGWHSFAPVAPHIGGEDLAVPSRWLICSDGLTDMLSDVEIERAMAAGDEEALRALFTQAMAAGGDDNISIIVVSVAAASG
jgi:serine/threonine protein phosphatase PrpC